MQTCSDSVMERFCRSGFLAVKAKWSDKYLIVKREICSVKSGRGLSLVRLLETHF